MFPMGSLYVGDLHPDVTEAMLYDKFSSAGQVLSLRICRDFRTKQSLSYGYVNFNSPRDAETALDTMNFDHLKGKPIRIMWCQRDPSLRKSGVGNVFIKNLDKNIDNKAMYDTFSAFGSILSCKVALDEDGYSKGYGFVHFESEDIANRAIEKFGTVTSSMVARNQDGTSKGFGFVAFEDANSAEKAAREMNGKEYDNRTLYVGRAQKKSERMNELRKKYEQQRMERFNKFQGLNLYIKNLDDSFTDDKLKAEFECFGKITSAKVMTENGRSRGFGFVCFSATEEANKAIHNMNAKIVGTKPLYVALAQRKEARRAFLTSQYVARAHAARQQGLQLPGGPPFLLPAVAQGPRIFGPAPALRAAPRWPSLQPLSRPNGASFELPLLGAAPFRAPSRPASIRVHARPITGVTVHTARPNSKYTTRHGPETFIADSRIVHAAPQEQKQLLGEQLFRIVEKLHPELAGKITGMLLEIDNSELVHMIKNQESLMAKVEEAIAVLEAHKVNKKGITVQDKA
ncbi:embryonic polyadenylate-binding protein-like isoform X3 [Euwallacea fornicatus]|uniref:embryonic polyadenylate-binding protein-like isoform X3 n=1 Tax=Euwallacea fornicatus TaxID=995702 RepID=UPI00338EA0C8